MRWTPVSEPPPQTHCLEREWYTSEPVLVWTQRKGGGSKFLVATLEQYDYDPTPIWYSNCSEHWNLHDTVKFWMPLPNPPKDQP